MSGSSVVNFPLGFRVGFIGVEELVGGGPLGFPVGFIGVEEWVGGGKVSWTDAVVEVVLLLKSSDSVKVSGSLEELLCWEDREGGLDGLWEVKVDLMLAYVCS